MDIFAPNSCALIVTIKDPNHMTINTVVNTWDVCFDGAFVDSINAKDRQMKSGPLLCCRCSVYCCVLIVSRVSLNAM